MIWWFMPMFDVSSWLDQAKVKAAAKAKARAARKSPPKPHGPTRKGRW